MENVNHGNVIECWCGIVTRQFRVSENRNSFCGIFFFFFFFLVGLPHYICKQVGVDVLRGERDYASSASSSGLGMKTTMKKALRNWTSILGFFFLIPFYPYISYNI